MRPLPPLNKTRSRHNATVLHPPRPELCQLEGLAGGNVDAGLTELGQAQAQALARWLPGELPAIDALYASTMTRAQETAAPLAAAYGCEIRHEDRLREVGNNRLDHTPWPNDDLPSDYADYSGQLAPFCLDNTGVVGW